MDMAMIDFAWKVMITLVNTAGWIWMYWANRDKVTNSRITSMEDDMNNTLTTHSDRLSRLEKDVSHSPTHEDLGRIYERMSGLEHRLGGRIEEINGAIKRIEGENNSQTRILNLVYESLITGGKQ